MLPIIILLLTVSASLIGAYFWAAEGHHFLDFSYLIENAGVALYACAMLVGYVIELLEDLLSEVGLDLEILGMWY